MNERMYELINQCFIGTTDGKLSELNTVANVEKFAELIVRECVHVVDAMADPDEDSDRYCWAIENAREKIKEHFGVE